MSALAGAYSRGGAALPRRVLTRMSVALADIGPDGESAAWGGRVGMLFRPFHTDRQSRRAQQPLAARDGWLLAFDGRLDNAAELRAEFGPGAGAADVEVALAVLRARGARALPRMVGDFALACWDPDGERLLLACDALGRRALYYRWTPEHLFWCSRARPLLNSLGASAELDEEFLADFLVNRPSPATPFRGVSVLPAGHVLVVDRGGARCTRYWAPDPQRRIEYRSDAEYEAHFAAVLEEAVACRLRADAPVYCNLSGGLDSTSLVCVADDLVRAGRVEAPELRTVSYVFDGAASSDERRYITPVEARLGRAGLHVSELRHPILAPFPASLRPDAPANQLSFLARQDHVTREMASHGARVLLCGIGGDHVLWSTPPDALPLADLAAAGKVSALLRAAAEWSRALRWPYFKTLWSGAVWPLLPRRVQAWQREEPLGEWIDPRFARRMGLRERMVGMPADGVRFRRPSQTLQYELIRRAMRFPVLEWLSSTGHVDVRYPFLDRRLVEFALAIPLGQLVRPHETRSVVRRALRGVIPEEVRTRRSKAGPDEAFHRALIREWPRLEPLFADSRAAALGVVDGGALLNALRRARHGIVVNSSQLLRTVSLELWLRTLEAGEPSNGPGEGSALSRSEEVEAGATPAAL
ncbi:MAG TPA: asparagine synthase-related protein [Longimicrobium sp.]|jgi:asparagine synthase (glutamine-hydrolysing)